MPEPSHTVDAPRQVKTMAGKEAQFSGPDFLNLSEVAEMLRLSKISIHRLTARRLISFYRIGRRVRFKREDVLRFLERRRYGGEET